MSHEGVFHQHVHRYDVRSTHFTARKDEGWHYFLLSLLKTQISNSRCSQFNEIGKEREGRLIKVSNT